MSKLQIPKYFAKLFPGVVKQLNDIVENKGYKYNKENNSFSIGNKTVATGEDQFVFGRNNIEDENKAEIVGGGIVKENIIVIDNNYECTYIGEHNNIEQVFFDNKLRELLANKYGDKWNNLSDDQKDLISSGLRSSPGFASSVYFVNKTYNEDTENHSTVMLYFTKPGKQNGYKKFVIMEDDNIRGDLSITSYKESSIEYKDVNENKNIRTLDWDGTQRNSGDVIATAEDGSEISMRDLLNRIKVLETK